MEIDRRTLLAGAGAALLAGLSPRRLEALEAQEALYVAARLEADGRHTVAVFTPDGRDITTVELPDRGHDVTVHEQSGLCVAFARRPGTFAAAFDAHGRREPQFFHAPQGRHFYGHGVFSPDGRLLYATENDFDNGLGFIGIYDATAGFRRIGEFSSGGVGPHEVLLAGDGRTLVVANGGMETHPDYGRTVLNLATMQPTLALIDRESGTILANHRLGADSRLSSIRHMAIDGNGAVWFGCQYQGAKSDRPQLVGRLALDGEPMLMEAPMDVLSGFNNYVGSVMASGSGEVIATSSPKGGQVVYWEAASGRVLGRTKVADGCGLAPSGKADFLISDGAGELLLDHPAAAGSPGLVARRAGAHWDNHMLRFAAS